MKPTIDAAPAVKRSLRTVGVLFLSAACVANQPHLRADDDGHEARTIANLQRAAKLPWRDEGACVVQLAALTWPEIVERCYDALDLERLRFQDIEGRCAVSQAGALAFPIARAVGICLVAQPELLPVVVVVGVVVIGAAILLELHRREPHAEEDVRRRVGRPASMPRPTLSPEPPPAPEREPQQRPTPSKDVFPPTSKRPECEIQPVCPRPTKDKAHDDCADDFPPNAFRGCDVLVNGKRFDALQVGTRNLWEIKTYRYDAYPSFVQEQAIAKNIEELEYDQRLAAACGYDFVVGVSDAAHAEALRRQLPKLTIVVTGCPR